MRTLKQIAVFLTGTAALLSTACLVACEKTKTEKAVAEPSEYPREETLYIGGFDWAPPTTFNPLDYDPNFPIDGNVRLMYETLVTYNQLDGNLEPMLADGFVQTDSSIVVHLDPRAKWNNGEPVSVEDVLYTFYIDSILPTPRHGNWLYIQSITSEGNNNISFNFTKNNKNPLIILNAIAETSILPKAVFEPLVQSAKKGKTYDFSKITEFKNDSIPVVSGPYNLKTFSPDKIVLERDANYWGLAKYNGKLPAPKYIIHSLYNGNNHFNSAMTKGNLDISSIFLPRIWDKAKDSIRAWSREEPYHLPGSITTLIVSFKSAPLTDIAFRQAMIHAINFEKIKTRAVSNYTPAIMGGFILPFGAEAKFFNKQDSDDNGFGYNVELAKKILTDAGYTWNDEGKLLDPKGAPVRDITIECPSGWTDWEDVIKVVVESFNEIGIPAKEHFVDYSIWDKDLRLGTFDLAMKTQTAELSAATPWARFDQIMGSNGGIKPFGEDAFSNQGRFKDENANKLLEKIPTITDEKELAEAYRELNKIFMETVPVLPVMYRPTQYYQFSTKQWTNFPTEENPYAPPQHLIVAAAVKALWQIKPVK
ncbi:MAG: ABC transporter substrate-binding protein [Fibrobacter sp.]|nr:ABC transporter substrate-binding protein [Fibrobacter sp.]